MFGALPRLCLIVDQEVAQEKSVSGLVEEISGALPPGALMTQVRDRDDDVRDLLGLVKRVKVALRARRNWLIVEDRLDVALAAGADGVLLPTGGFDVYTARRVAGERDFAIGVEALDADAAGAAARDGADFICAGPVWARWEHRPPPVMGVEGLARVVKAAREGGCNQVFATGGASTEAHARAADQCGAYGIAAARAFSATNDVSSLAADLVRPWTDTRR